MRSPEPLAVTWSNAPSPQFIADARRVSATWALPLFERPHKRGLGPQLGVVANAFLVRGGQGWSLVDATGALGVSPGLAMLRLKRLGRGTQMPDRLLLEAAIRPGEVVVDATCGLGADARVLASAAGPGGRVIGLEASKPLAVLLAEGLPLETPWPSSGPIEVHHADAETWLRAQPSRSVDVVFFDPMFERTKKASPAFDELRRFADARPLPRAAVDEARRVARRMVLMKSSDPALFPALGLEPVAPQANAFVYWGRSTVV
ncbi:MAG: class I SAM-dependent methyltransferase [Myxococcales bacterium]|nr:class I SAM-dependent methyltransferase [Myxococcales bacterium]